MTSEPLITIDGVELVLRRAIASDRNYVLDTWIRSYKDRSGCDDSRYFSGERRVATHHFDAGLVWTATSAGSPMIAHAWICGAPGLLHYVFVPRELRRLGLAKALVGRVGGTGGTRTHKWASHYVRGWTFDPYQLWETSCESTSGKLP